MIRIPFCLLALMILFAGTACRNTAAPDKAAASAQTPATPAAGTASTGEKLYPSLPVERMQELFNSVDYIDFVFYYTNFSMNQSDENSIKATFGHVATEVPVIDPSCQPIGSLFFQSQGKELMQAELYFTENCIYFVWLENGQRTYANKMTPNGLKFYQQIFSQATTGN